MLELIPVFIASIGSIIAGWIDAKTTEIPDWIINSMLIGGLVYLAIQAFLGNYSLFIESFITGLAAFIFGVILYFGGQWGGGDAKLLAAILFLIPTVPSMFSPNLLFPFPLALTINVFLIGAVYIIIYAFFFASKNPKIRKEFIKSIKDKSTLNLIIVSVISLLALWVYFRISFGISANMILYLIPGIFGLILLYIYLKVVEKKGFVKKIKTSKLREGDMIGENIPSLGLDKKIIEGLTKAQIKKIKRMKKTVLIRDGVRFGPVFILAILATLYYGDLILLIF